MTSGGTGSSMLIPLAAHPLVVFGYFENSLETRTMMRCMSLLLARS